MKSDRRRRKDKEDGNAKQKCKEADWHGAFYRADYWASVARQFHQIWRIFNILSADSNCGRDGTLWMDCWRMVGFRFWNGCFNVRRCNIILRVSPPCDNFHCDSKRHSCRSSCICIRDSQSICSM